MASSSVSQEDVEVDFETSSRRSRIRTARARNINPTSRPGTGEADEEGEGSDRDVGTGGGLYPGAPDHDASPKPATRLKEKRMNRPNHTNKGKQQRDRRKLREKRRSTGVVHLPSTESTGGSTGEDEELLSMTAETRRNTHYNEHLEKEKAGEHHHSVVSGPPSLPDHKHKKSFTSHRNKSPSDLEADDEDNQDYDSLTMSDSTLSLVQPASAALPNLHSSNSLQTTRPPANGRPATPTTESVDELLESAREENRRLLGLLEERDRRISSLESRLSQLTGELSQACNDRSNLRQENNALIRAIASLTTK
ncbi:PRKC apoptosis WT1 regulator protein-like isoform X1 [Penaeus vannamei]|uniref:PRKC apoptosis WT1 regulator protein-like isoform X1 n=1 Tax=Penaeus vannamei TaxID=6689 RepID=UPI000F6736C9|nr:PRKC apoptosis WT1 regulator protein-like isoform X1 [Penaeus vannamei]XP_027215559.1 PRKC apoptosis WT1 regulator protein-like isoform X1 [Penaeus vannamei]